MGSILATRTAGARHAIAAIARSQPNTVALAAVPAANASTITAVKPGLVRSIRNPN